jgi:hypothetical protein
MKYLISVALRIHFEGAGLLPDASNLTLLDPEQLRLANHKRLRVDFPNEMEAAKTESRRRRSIGVACGAREMGATELILRLCLFRATH